MDSTGPIVLGTRLENSQEPRAWRSITYGKGSWIIQMLRQRMGDERFLSMLAELTKRYDSKPIATEDFRALAAEFLPPKSDDPKLETFFDQWVYGTGIPSLKLTYSVKGAAPNLKLTAPSHNPTWTRTSARWSRSKSSLPAAAPSPAGWPPRTRL